MLVGQESFSLAPEPGSACCTEACALCLLCPLFSLSMGIVLASLAAATKPRGLGGLNGRHFPRTVLEAGSPRAMERANSVSGEDLLLAVSSRGGASEGALVSGVSSFSYKDADPIMGLHSPDLISV